MRAKGWTDETLGAALGVTRSYVTMLRGGEVCPSLPMAVEIERVSRGDVTCRDLVPADRLLETA
jgi:DNA-binding transcriptional regulator YdaS (Cro superfamily)